MITVTNPKKAEMLFLGLKNEKKKYCDLLVEEKKIIYDAGHQETTFILENKHHTFLNTKV